MCIRDRFITVKTVIVRALYVAAMFLFVRKGSDLLPYTLILSLTYTEMCIRDSLDTMSGTYTC